MRRMGAVIIFTYIDPNIFKQVNIPATFGAYMGVSKNNGTPKSSILVGFSIINHPFWGTPIFGNTHMGMLNGWHEKYLPLRARISRLPRLPSVGSVGWGMMWLTFWRGEFLDDEIFKFLGFWPEFLGKMVGKNTTVATWDLQPGLLSGWLNDGDPYKKKVLPKSDLKF